MKPDATVVHLNVGPGQPATVAPGSLPTILTQVRDQATQQLKQSLQALFENADDTLFAMADRATSNTEQNALFEAMRDVRLNRHSIEQNLLKSVRETFAKLNQYQVSQPLSEDAVSFESLALVQHDALEESVAMDSMVSNVLSRDRLALTQLTTRINVLISKKLDDTSNPLNPRLLCGFFLTECRTLGMEIKVKLILFKLLEKYLLNDLEQLYAQANQLLVNAGILPDLKLPAVRRNPSPAVAPGVRAEHRTTSSSHRHQGEQNVQEVFAVLQALLSQVRETALPPRQIPADARPISSHDLLRLLSHLQARLPQTAVAADEFDLRNQLDNLLLRASAKSGTARVVGEMDDDVISLVGMLFGFILDDRSLSDSLKVLIVRMQIPMLKVAVLDKTLFSQDSHPARRLLNEIASAALGWDEQGIVQRDALYLKIESVVQRLLHEFIDDPGLFAELLADFLAFTGAERRRSELFEQRTRDAAQGSAKAELARRQVEQALNARLLGKTLPSVVVRLLQDAWSKVLLLICLKQGCASPQWTCALATMDELIWSVEPHDDPDARLSLLERVPGLLKALRDGLHSAAVDPFVTRTFFGQLEALHVQTFQRFKQPPHDERTPTAAAMHGAAVALVYAGDSLATAAAQASAHGPASMVEVIEPVVLRAPGEGRAPEPELELNSGSGNDAALLSVDNLRIGSWVEFQQEPQHRLRCKLAILIKPTDQYIFVNRTGMKVLEKTRLGLALEFRRGTLRLLDDALLFDRALESVIDTLRRLQDA